MAKKNASFDQINLLQERSVANIRNKCINSKCIIRFIRYSHQPHVQYFCSYWLSEELEVLRWANSVWQSIQQNAYTDVSLVSCLLVQMHCKSEQDLLPIIVARQGSSNTWCRLNENRFLFYLSKRQHVPTNQYTLTKDSRIKLAYNGPMEQGKSIKRSLIFIKETNLILQHFGLFTHTQCKSSTFLSVYSSLW